MRHASATSEDEAMKIGAADVSKRFAIFNGDVIRCLLVSTRGRHLLVLTIHHVACDGVSAALIMMELK